MIADDLYRATEIAALGFPDHFEGRECFANRLALYPAGCFVLAHESALPLGYLIAYPWLSEDAPALNTLIDALPADASVMYLHDLAIHPEGRGQGFTRPIIERVAAEAFLSGCQSLSLVAVNNAAGFWQRQGFVVRESIALRAKLKSYGPDACYMMRELGLKSARELELVSLVTEDSPPENRSPTDRATALQTVILSSYLHRPESLIAIADDGKLEQLLAWARQAQVHRAEAMQLLSSQDLTTLRTSGYLLSGE